MKYIPSKEIKGTGVGYEGIDNRIPWIIGDGTLDSLSEKFHLKGKEDVVDIGCGNGKTLEYFKESAKTLSGIDLNNYLNVASKDEIEFHTLDLNFDPLPYDDESKDLIFALQVVEHLENPFHIMREAHRVLRPKGVFIFSVPNPYTLASKLKYLFSENLRRWNLRNDHLLFLTRDVFDKTYGEYFDVLEARYQKGLMPLIGRVYRLLGIKSKESNTKILPRSKTFGDAACYVLQKK